MESFILGALLALSAVVLGAGHDLLEDADDVVAGAPHHANRPTSEAP